MEEKFITIENGQVKQPVPDGVYKLFSSDGEYQGFVIVVNQKVVESQDIDSSVLLLGVSAIKIAEVPKNREERKAIAYSHGFFTQKEW